MAEFAIDYGQVGTLVGLFMLPGLVFALPGGLLGKRFGDKSLDEIQVELFAVRFVMKNDEAGMIRAPR